MILRFPPRNLLLARILLTVLSVYSVSYSQLYQPRILPASRAREPISIDGRLTETIWRTGGEEGFVQREPYEGATPSERTAVWVAYDDDALYVAARLYDSQPDSIIGRLARRDVDIESDRFGFAVDAAFDRRTARYFTVNPVGAVEDGIFSNDTWKDANWDGVWDVAVQTDSLGWSAEFRIPYSQFRFPKRDQYTWGIECFRRIQRRNEEDFLVLHPRNDAVRVSRWLELHRIEGIEPPARIELMPYAAATGKFLQHPSTGAFNDGRTDPFKLGRDYLGDVGVDAKIGLSGDVTLDATLNPDFAQVEVDPAVVNLTAYEVLYQEKRQFFIEGSNILSFGKGGATTLQNFNWRDPNFFYSRRIGRAPQGWVTHEGFSDVPDRTTILGAAKVSGKIDNSWSVAALTALTDREYGRVDSAGVRFKEEIEPLTFYGIVRTQKEFNEARQAIGIIGTLTERNLREPRLERLLNKRALSLGIDGWSFLDQEKEWVVTGWLGSSYIEGSKARLIDLQHSPIHYFQRPDADHIEVDSNATSMTGWATRVWLDKVKGNLIFNASIGVIHPKFDLNDVGYLYFADYINSHIYVGYQWFEPDNVFRTKYLTAAAYRDYDFGGFKIAETYRLMLNGQFLNFWSFYLHGGYNAETFDNQRTRGGPLMKYLGSQFLLYGVYSDTRKEFSGSLTGYTSSGASGGWQTYTSLNLNWKASKTLQIRGGPELTRVYNTAQWITTITDPTATETYGKRYIFGTLDQTLLSATVRVNWTFTPKLSFQLYLQPLFSTGSYSDFKELARPRTYTFNHYGEGDWRIERSGVWYQVTPLRATIGTMADSSFSFRDPNFNFKSLRANAVLRWEFLPGSTLYFVWTNEKVNKENRGEFRFGRDFRTLLNDTPDNVYSIKITYWLNP